MATRQPMVRPLAAVPQEEQLPASVIVPTRHEAGNIYPLIARIVAAVTPAAIVFVDDSDGGDPTPSVINEAADRMADLCRITLLHRPPGRRPNGLGGAVVAGLEHTGTDWACVMDADLQHPPELLPAMFEVAGRGDADLVIASRRIDGGNSRGLSAARKVISSTSTVAARVLFPRRLAGVSDPLSGFFMIRRSAITGDLRPRGFKILLEIAVRNPQLRKAEVGFEFCDRNDGTSKGTFKEGMRYGRHLMELRLATAGR